jgi:hypothetical protein
MFDGDFGADRILSGVTVLPQQLATGLLDIAYQKGGAVNAAFFAHEADAAVAVHGKVIDP